ncbi:DNA mismatch repair protein MutS [Thermus sp. LT1-2-5]|uniref:MutS-related protein n=1 Tax=Thermus sp. LT1-2-5 TaxID=3026935 RepID=UPI0030E7B9DF
MRVGLLDAERDLLVDGHFPPFWEDLEADLGLEALWEVMAAGDAYLRAVARQVLAQGLGATLDQIRYRQATVQEALEKPELVEAVYRLSTATLEAKRRESWGLFRRDRPDLYGSIKAMEALLSGLRQLKALMEGPHFSAPGFRALQERLRLHLTPRFFQEAEGHLQALRFSRGVWMGARLRFDGRGEGYFLIPPEMGRALLPWKRPKSYTLTLHPRDESGARILGELREEGIVLAAWSLAQAAEEVGRFFEALRAEAAFLLSAIHLARALRERGLPVAFPEPWPREAGPGWIFRGLYDVVLALRQGTVVGNDLEARGKNPVFVTGANRGGKTTFLRSLGIAQLMMQAGLFVGAEAFATSISPGVFTHFRREESASLEAGKFLEEVQRFSSLVDHLSPGALLLLNETFASTSEAEGSALGAQVVRALTAHGVRVAYVTHFYALVEAFRGDEAALFLKAERLPDGRRTYRLQPGTPEPTAYAEDLLRLIFGYR